MAGAVDPQTLFAAIAYARDISPAQAAAEVNDRMANEKIPFATIVAENRGAIDSYERAITADRNASAGTGDGADDAAGSVGPSTPAPAPALRVVTRRARAAQAAAEQAAPQAPQQPPQRSLRETLNLIGVEIARILDRIDPQVGISFDYVPGLAGSEYQGWIVHASILDLEETEDGPALVLDEETGRIASSKITEDYKLDPSDLGGGLDLVITTLMELSQRGSAK